jgi:hypothetical protein
MKRITCSRFCLAILSFFVACQVSQAQGDSSKNSAQTGPARGLFAADYHKKTGALLRSDNSEVWKIEIRDIHDAQRLPNGHWLLQTTFQNVIEVDDKGKEVWRYDAGKNDKGETVEIHAFRRLENGLTMIAESGTRRIIEVNAKKEIQRSIPLTVKNPNPHRDTRNVRPTDKGTYVVAHEGDQCVREYDGAGNVIWEYAVGSQLYSAVRLPNGNTLIGTGDGHRVIEVSPEKKIVWEVGERDLPNIQLVWITMVDRLPNGNTWIVNCHAGPDNPQILEVSPDKKVVWSFLDFSRFGNALPVAVPVFE